MKKTDLLLGFTDGKPTTLVVTEEPLGWWLAAEFAVRVLMCWGFTWPLGNRICNAAYDRARDLAEIPATPGALAAIFPNEMVEHVEPPCPAP